MDFTTRWANGNAGSVIRNRGDEEGGRWGLSEPYQRSGAGSSMKEGNERDAEVGAVRTATQRQLGFALLLYIYSLIQYWPYVHIQRAYTAKKGHK